MRARFLAFLVLGGCATSNRHTASPLSDSQRLIVIETRRMAGETMFDLVTRTRPNFLRARTPLTRPLDLGEEMIGVFVNGHFVGGAESLRDISSDGVFAVRRLTVSEALMRYARRFRDGAIEVTLLPR